ncbi:hypothetical protein [uncultured Roseobacter sp.]|uniref:hypothetical protein n=1 Tax=uncultured Roseobacter sp. TaxID=114847 RepID=UPI00261F5027|nr:hypothetical protein [uncultured Roseobacter sp.]
MSSNSRPEVVLAIAVEVARAYEANNDREEACTDALLSLRNSHPHAMLVELFDGLERGLKGGVEPASDPVFPKAAIQCSPKSEAALMSTSDRANACNPLENTSKGA